MQEPERKARPELTEENTEKLRKASVETGKSLNELTNLIISAIEYTEIVTVIKLKLNIPVEAQQPRRRSIIRQITVSHRF